MPDYEALKRLCDDCTRISSSVLDEFLIYYAAAQDHADKEMDTRLVPYKHITRELDPAWVRMLKSQYIAQRIFRENGYIHRYLRHSAVKLRSAEELDYLAMQARSPWCFRFCISSANPAPDFYQMTDVFTGLEFLLYSPAMTRGLKEAPAMLWLMLLADNGGCYQSFGPLVHFRSFDADDIYFFATELHPDIESDDDLVEDVQDNPVPYLMLLSGSAYPITVHQSTRLVHHEAEYDLESLNTKLLEPDFILTTRGGVTRGELKGLEQNPHFALFYFDATEKTIKLRAMSDEGYEKLVNRLAAHGYVFDVDSDVRVGMSMLVTAGNIFKKTLMKEPYPDLFNLPPSAEEQAGLDEMNGLIRLMLPDINAGTTPDYEALSLKTGMPVESIREVAAQIMATIDKMTRGKR